jgi:3-phenylpropionate/trans-cinnamate dioxygenase ferredoxin reductase subunit
MAFVIVGGSLAGVNAAETLRSEGFTGQITMIGDDPAPPYERPPLSKGYLLGNAPLDSVFVHPPSWYPSQRIDLRLSRRVVAIAPSAHTVTLDSAEQLGYDRLLLATGSRPRRLDIPGAALPHVHYLRTISDSTALKELLGPGRHVVVIGAGWIGLETAAAFRTHGGVVTVVEMESLPLRRVLGDEVASIFRDLHTSHGVTFHFGQSVSAITPSAVQLSSGASVPADVVIVGVGVTPATELAVTAGLSVEDGVVVSSFLQTSDPHIYACGDVANWEHPLLGTRLRVEHWENARQSGAAAARAMLGQPVSYDWIPYFFSDQYESYPGVGMEYSGWVARGGYDSVVFRGDPSVRSDANPEFCAFWVKDGRVLAGMNVNVWDIHDDIRALISAGFSGKAVDLVRLADPQAPLADLIG